MLDKELTSRGNIVYVATNSANWIVDKNGGVKLKNCRVSLHSSDKTNYRSSLVAGDNKKKKQIRSE